MEQLKDTPMRLAAAECAVVLDMNNTVLVQYMYTVTTAGLENP
jgi:hypothetical protein